MLGQARYFIFLLTFKKPLLALNGTFLINLKKKSANVPIVKGNETFRK